MFLKYTAFLQFNLDYIQKQAFKCSYNQALPYKQNLCNSTPGFIGSKRIAACVPIKRGWFFLISLM